MPNIVKKPSTTSLTLFSENISNTVRRWRSDLDSTTFYMPEVPHDADHELRIAAEAHKAALQPATPIQVMDKIFAMIPRTHRQNRSDAEHQTAISGIAKALAPFPIDIIDQAITDFLAQPGTAFFPKNSGEILKFAKPLLDQRHVRAYRLGILADEAHARKTRQSELDQVDEIPLTEIRKWPVHTRQTALDRGWITQAQFDQSSEPEP